MSEKEKRVAFFDSGIGGLTVLKECIKILPDEDYIYFADTDNVPYGIKTKRKVKGLIFDAVEFIVKHDIKMLVVACNTATSVAIADLRARYNFPIVGMEPAVKPALERCLKKKVLVLATSLTLRLEKLERLISALDKNHRVDKLPLDGLVEFAERFEFDTDNVRKYLQDMFQNLCLSEYEAVVLGCTHFIYFKELFRLYFKNDVAIIDGNEGTVRNIKRILSEKSLLNDKGKSDITFFISKRENPQISKEWLKLLEG